MSVTSLKTYSSLMKDLKKSLAELKESQWLAFCDIINFAYEHVPFYKDLYKQSNFSPEALKDPSDLTLVPPTRKEMFRQENLARRLTQGLTLEKLLQKRTSGTSGSPLTV